MEHLSRGVFYLIFPLIIARRLQLPLAIAYAFSLCFLPNRIVQILNIGFPSFFYFNPIARLLEFSFGMALYSFYQKCEISTPWASVSQFCSLGVLSWLVSISATLDTHYRNVVLLLPFGFIILSFARDGLLSNIMASTFFVILGDSSFALYMVHHMFFRSIDPQLHALNSPILALAVAVFAVILLSVGIHFVFERPMRSWLSARATQKGGSSGAAAHAGQL